MLVKEIVRKEYHYDNVDERNKKMEAKKSMGYKILEFGSDKDFYFISEMEVPLRIKE